MKKFICKNCNYDFNPKSKEKMTPPKICPYCGENGHVQVKKHIIEEL